MKTIEDIIKLLGLGVLSVKEHREASTARKVTEFRQTLLTDVKQISTSGSAELIVAMEKALVQHDLEYYANSKTMTGSLKTALSEFAMIERQLGKVDDPEKYKATDQSFGLAKNRSKGLPLDEARQAFKSHYARLVNLDNRPARRVRTAVAGRGDNELRLKRRRRSWPYREHRRHHRPTGLSGASKQWDLDHPVPV